MTPTRKQSDNLDSVARKTVLTPEEKTELICRYAGGARLKALASEYDIAYSTAHKICNDKKLRATLFKCKDNFSLVKNLRVSLSPLNISDQTQEHTDSASPCSDVSSSEETKPLEQVHDVEVHVDSDLNTSVILSKIEQPSLIESPVPVGLDKTLDSWVKSMKENCQPVTDNLLIEKARQAFVEATGSEEGFSDLCEWLVDLRSKYGLLNGKDISKEVSQMRGHDTAKKRLIFKDESDSKSVNVSISECDESSDAVKNSVEHEDSGDIPLNLTAISEGKKLSPDEVISKDQVLTGISLSKLKVVPKGQFKVKFNFHRKTVSFSPGLKPSDSKRRMGPYRIQTPGPKKKSSSKFVGIKYDFIKKLAAKQNLQLSTAKDIHSDKKKLEAFMSRCVVKVRRESLQSVRSSLENVVVAKVPLNEMKGLKNSEELKTTGKDESVTTGKVSSSVSLSKSKLSVPQLDVREFSGKNNCETVDMVENVKEHQNTNVNCLEKLSEIDQPVESTEVKQSAPRTEAPEIGDKGSEIVQPVEDSKKNQETDGKVDLDSKKFKPSFKQKAYKKKGAGFNQETIKKLALKYDIGVNTINGIRKDTEKLKAFLTLCEVSLKHDAVKSLVNSTKEAKVLAEQKDYTSEVQDLERNSAKDVGKYSNKVSLKRKVSSSGEEVVAKKRALEHNDVPKISGSLSEDKSELRSFLSPCVVHSNQDSDPSSPSDCIAKLHKQSPVKASSAKSLEQSPVKAASAKSQKQSTVKASSAKSLEQSPARAASAKSPKESPVKASNAKSPKQSPVKASCAKSPEQSPVKDGIAKSPKQNLANTSSTELLKQSPIKARNAKSPKQSPVKASSADLPEQDPVKARSVKSPEQSPVKDSIAKSPGQNTVKASSAKSPKQRPVKASSAESPKQCPAKVSRAKLPKQSPVKANSAKLLEQSPVEDDSAKSPVQNLVKTSNAESSKQSPVRASCAKSPKQSLAKSSRVKSPKQSPVKVSSTKLQDQSPVRASSTKPPKQSPVKASEGKEVVREWQAEKQSDTDLEAQHKKVVELRVTETSEGILEQSEVGTQASEQSKNSSRATELAGMSITVAEQSEIDKKSKQKGMDTVSAGLIEADTTITEQAKTGAQGIQPAESDVGITQVEESDAEGMQLSETDTAVVQQTEKNNEVAQKENVATVVETICQKNTSQTEICFDAVKPVIGSQDPVIQQLAGTPRGKALGKSDQTVNMLAEDYNINRATIEDISRNSEKLKAFLSKCFVSVNRESVKDSQNVSEACSSITTVATPEPAIQKLAFKRPSSANKASVGSAKKPKGEKKLLVKFKFF